jgi:hypothetical protein
LAFLPVLTLEWKIIENGAMGKLKNIYNERGQVVVEYILLLAVLVSIMLPLIKIIGRQMTEDCPSESFICKIQTTYSREGVFGGSFRRYTLRR